MNNITLENAIELLSKKVEFEKVIAYWKRGTTFILQVDYGVPNVKVPSYFIVSPDLPIRPTNPAKSSLKPEDRKQL